MTEHRHPFLTRLDDGPLLADGAIGTVLHDRGVPWGHSLDDVTRTDRELVLQMHLDYLRAGAGLITTNTFGANRVRLREHGLEESVRHLNLHAVKVAREAREVVGTTAFVAGAVGAIARQGESIGARRAELRDAYAEQVAALVEGGADLVHLETFGDLADLELAIEAVRSTCDLPVIASMSFDHDLRAGGDRTPEEVATRLTELGVDVIGINCSVGPHHALQVVERFRDAGAAHVSVMANAGMATRRATTFLYHATPEYFASYVGRFLDAGAVLVGGCCGTTPHHVRSMADSLAIWLDDSHGERPAPAPRVERPAPLPAPVEDEPTRLRQALDAGEFVVSVELAPPKGANPEKVLAGAQLLASHGLEFVNVTDSAMARVRMGAIAVARLVQDHAGVEAIIHTTTRDRNLMALQGDLLGAHALGVRNVLALTGDPPSIGDYPDATGVWDVDSVGLVEALARMNAGTDFRGRDLGGETRFCAGAAVNPTAVDLPLELERFTRKLEAGAEFAMSQPIYDMATLEAFLERVDPLDIPLLLGVLPLQSARHAEYLHNEVPGIEVPVAHRRAMHDAGADGIARGIELAHAFIDEAQALAQGIYLMPSFGRYETCAQVLAALDSSRRPTTTTTTDQTT